ncbi:MAG: ABC-2 family transporter protein [Actinobacteria bacterium]|nr:ABC-2 family transporter protein [Actinomycetota bacterium]MBW3649113.1 ABC-2 family transporter protein [Actinomycetota bacterium]
MRADRTSAPDAARLTVLFLRIGALNELQYRANFFIQLMQSLLALATGLVVLALVFDRTDELGGWSRPQLLAVLGVFTLMGGIIRSVIQPNMQRLLEEIRLGTLDYLLLKPEDGQVLASIREVRIWQAVDILVGGVVVAAAVVQLEGRVGWLEAASFLGLLALGATTIYCFWLMLAAAGFWLVRMDEVQELFTGIYRAGAYPVGIYPGWLRAVLTFLVPLAFAVTVPAEAVTGRLEQGNAALALGMTAALVLVSRRVFRMGLRRYSGASA